jgi:Heme exporter protein D (CcmD)
MNPWHFILGAYVVTAIAIVIEVLAVRARHRAALSAARDTRSNRKTDSA